MLSRRDVLRFGAGLVPASRIFAWQESKESGAGEADVRFSKDVDARFSTGVNVVNVLTTVHDKQGKAIKNLVKDDFTLEEDGRPQIIKYFSQQSDLPLTLGLLIDTSGSQRRVLDQERRASARFFEQVLREDKDKAFIIHFDYQVELLQDLTSRRSDLEHALNDIESERPQLNRPGQGGGGGNPGGGRYPQGARRGGGTALYDAVLLASDELMKKEQGRKALILLSDGVDNGSKVGLSTGIEAAQRADTLVYSILFSDPNAYGNQGFGQPGAGRRRGGFGHPGGPFPGGGGGYPGGGGNGRSGGRAEDGKKTLRRISDETGGSYFEVSSKDTIENIYSRIEDDLRSQYNLGYTSDQTGAGYRTIRVDVKIKSLVAQARQGYYARQ